MRRRGRLRRPGAVVTAVSALTFMVAGCSSPQQPPTPLPPAALDSAAATAGPGPGTTGPVVPDGLIENGIVSDLAAGLATAPTLQWTAPWPVGGASSVWDTHLLQRNGVILISGGPIDDSHFAVAALDARTGRRLWLQEGAGGHMTLNTLGDLLIENQVLNDQGRRTSRVLDLATGAVRWTAAQQDLSPGPPGSAAVIGDGRVFDAATGRVRWRFPVAAVGVDEPAVVPAVMPYGLVLQDCRAGTLRALGWADGHPLWTVAIPRTCPSAVLPTGRLAVVFAGPWLTAYTPTGTRAWRQHIGAESVLGVQPLGQAATMVLPWDSRRIIRIDNATGTTTTVQVDQQIVGLISITTPTGTAAYRERSDGVQPLNPATLTDVGAVVAANPEIKVDLTGGVFNRVLTADSAYQIAFGQDGAGRSVEMLRANDLATGRIRWQVPAPSGWSVVSPGPVVLVRAGQNLLAYS